MSSARSFALLAALPALAAAAVGDVVGAGFIRRGITAKLPPSSNDWVKRQNAVQLEDQRTGTLYTIDLGIGTPSQDVSVILDTGSSELWVSPNCAAAGSASNTAFCKTLPQFDPNASTSLVDTGVSGEISYGKGHVDMEYVLDFVRVGSSKIEGQIFGAATDSTDIPAGILGLAPPVSGTKSYSLVLDSMADQGLINSRAFSLDLRSIDSPDDGSIIFGGIDTMKFQGSLEKVPILDLSASLGDRYWISMSSAAITLPDGTEKSVYTGSGFPVFLDSGGTLSRLPTTIFNGVGGSMPTSQYDAGSGYYIVDCSVAEMEGSVDFGFGNKIIRVQYKDVIWHIPESTFCVIGILPDDEQSVLGDSFLRAAYVVYDQDNRNLHLAQADNCGENLVAIGSGPDAVPSLTGECGAPSTTAPPSSTASETATETATETASETATETASETASETATETASETATETASETATETASETGTETEYPGTSETATETEYPGTSFTVSYGTALPTGSSSPIDVYPTSTILYPTYNGTETDSAGPTAYPTYTSTYTSSNVRTHSGYETTDYVILTTTYCPGNEGPSPSVTYAPKPTYTTTYKVRQTYTVTQCPPTVTNCPIGHVTTEESYTTLTWHPEAPVTTVVGLESIAPWGPGGVVHYPTTPVSEAHYTTTPASEAHYTTYPGGEAYYPTTTLATSPSYVGSTANTYPTASQIVTAGAGKVKSGVFAAGIVAAVVAMIF